MWKRYSFIHIVLLAITERAKPEVTTADSYDSKLNKHVSFRTFRTEPSQKDIAPRMLSPNYGEKLVQIGSTKVKASAKGKITDPNEAAHQYLEKQWDKYKTCRSEQASSKFYRNFNSRRRPTLASTRKTHKGYKKDCAKILIETLKSPFIAGLPKIISSTFGHLIALVKEDTEKQTVKKKRLKASSTKQKGEERIIGGIYTPDGKYPYQASLQFENRHFCAGSIVNKRWILTAAHCEASLDIAQVNIMVGSNSNYEGGDRYSLEEFILHPDYIDNVKQNDVALIRVAEDIVFSNRVQPVLLPTEDFTEANRPAVLAGWGLTAYPNNTGPSTYLRNIEVRVISLAECRDRWMEKNQTVDDKSICVLPAVGEGACKGDSGGPLVADGVQIGIASWVYLCAYGYPDVFTRVWCFIDWINWFIVQ